MGYKIYTKFQKEKKRQNYGGIKPQRLGAKGSDESRQSTEGFQDRENTWRDALMRDMFH